MALLAAKKVEAAGCEGFLGLFTSALEEEPEKEQDTQAKGKKEREEESTTEQGSAEERPPKAARAGPGPVCGGASPGRRVAWAEGYFANQVHAFRIHTNASPAHERLPGAAALAAAPTAASWHITSYKCCWRLEFFYAFTEFYRKFPD